MQLSSHLRDPDSMAHRPFSICVGVDVEKGMDRRTRDWMYRKEWM